MDIKGRGFDHAMLLKDFYLMEWIGANSTRTSHYPYAEEFMQLCDQKGIVIIDEIPAVGMRYVEDGSAPTFCEERISSRTLAHHKQVMGELIARDKNHPCVVMWNIANEPHVFEEKGGEYFKEVATTTRELDPTRPISLVTGDVVKPHECLPFEYIDVMCINRYHSWYSDPGHTELIEMQIVNELTPWFEQWRRHCCRNAFTARRHVHRRIPVRSARSLPPGIRPTVVCNRRTRLEFCGLRHQTGRQTRYGQ
jgi:beta-glucuronidase